jgi:hypothetical protein
MNVVYEKKIETLSKFKEFKEKTKNDFYKKIRYLCTDNGREYLSHDFETYLKRHKIQRQLTCPNTHNKMT